MMQEQWRIFKDFRFEAAHKLPHHTGKCQRLHGHSWKGRVYVEGTTLHRKGSMTGMVYDFSEISQKFIKPLLENYLDHHYLNDSLKLESPTCEEIARWTFQYFLDRKLQGLAAVEIFETCTSGVLYSQSTS